MLNDMISPKHAQHFYQFGPFCLDTRERILLRDNQAVPLTPKAFDILLVLVTNNQHIVEKDDLMKQVWPDSFVEEGNLTFNISILRKALGEGAGEHAYIETVPRRGYRFIAGVTELWQDAPDLIVEEHIRSAISIEEKEETTDEINADQSRQLKALDASSRTNQRGWWRSRPVFLAIGALLVAFAIALYSFWISDRTPRTETNESLGRSPRTIAVLPFRPISAEGRDEYLELGMADALITKLSNIRQVIVRPTSSVRKYFGAEQNPVAAGRELKVESVLEGSVQRLGDRIRVTVQLVNVRDGRPLWAFKCDDVCTDIFAVQDSISDKVAGALAVELTGEEQSRLSRRYTENTEAYQLYLKGRYFWNKRNQGGIKKAIEYFQEAIDKDPNYARAYAGLAECYAVSATYHVLPPNESHPRAKAAALKALEIDETLGEAHATLAGFKKEHEWDFAGAEMSYKRAIELNPNYATTHQWYGEYLIWMGRYAEAKAEIRRAQELDPLSLIINVDLGCVYYFAGETDRSIEQFRRTIEMDPNFHQAHAWLGRVYAQKRMYKEALAELQRAIDLSGDPAPEAWLGYVYAVAGQRSKALAVLNRLERLSKRGYVSPYFIASVYAGLGETDRAFVWLQKAYEDRDSFLIWCPKADPMFDSLRPDPRFADLARRIGFAP